MTEPHLKIKEIHRIVNIELWDKFSGDWKYLLRSKSADPQVLAQLGLSAHEIRRRVFENRAEVAGLPYSDNVALLFHGTRAPEGLNTILLEGLDERVANPNGMMGRGIYFTDSPAKALKYDRHGTLLLFAVYLGDCIGIPPIKDITQKYVKEYKKSDEQKRVPGDGTFDSIMTRNGPEGNNEFVIYNRQHCCPLYTITYDKNPDRALLPKSADPYNDCRFTIPPFVWTPRSRQQQSFNEDWPFSARSIFERMKNYVPDSLPQPTLTIQDTCIAKELGTLAELGFKDAELNTKLLKKYGRNLERTIHFLLKKPNSILSLAPTVTLQTNSGSGATVPIPVSAASAETKVKVPSRTGSGTKINSDGVLVRTVVDLTLSPPQVKRARSNPPNPPGGKSPPKAEEEESCHICSDDFPIAPENWKVLYSYFSSFVIHRYTACFQKLRPAC
jgi:hypothetical protein